MTWQGGAWQAKLQWLPLPQVQVPLAQTAWQLGLSPSQVTWQGGALQPSSQLAPWGQPHTPLWQPPDRPHPKAVAKTNAAASPISTGSRTCRRSTGTGSKR